MKSTNDSEKYLSVMEYADGGTLRRYLNERFGSLTWDDKFNLASQLACAVSYLHSEEIVHHDLVIHFNFVILHIIHHVMCL